MLDAQIIVILTIASVYQNPTFSGVFTNFGSFILDIRKHELTETLLYRSFRLWSSYESFHWETVNNYPKSFVNHFNNMFLNKLFIHKDLNFMVPKRVKFSLDLGTKLQGAIERDLPYCKLKVILDVHVHGTTCFNLKSHLRKKITLE